MALGPNLHSLELFGVCLQCKSPRYVLELGPGGGLLGLVMILSGRKSAGVFFFSVLCYATYATVKKKWGSEGVYVGDERRKRNGMEEPGVR